MGWIEQKVVLITGAAFGLGRGFAEALAAEGAALALCDVRPEVHDVAAALRDAHGGQVEAWMADVGEPAHAWLFVDDAVERFGGVDVLVNNAGTWERTAPTDRLDESVATFDRLLAVNTRGVFLLGRAVMPLMLERGGGHIVNIVTDHVYTEPGRPTGGGSFMDVYDASKWAVNGLTLAWARALEGRVRVNGLCMGATDSLMLRRASVTSGAELTEELIGSWKRPAEVAALLVQLLEEGPQGRTGWNLPIWVDEPVVMPEPTGDWAVRVGTMKASGM